MSGLSSISRAFGKSHRTIQRWCEEGIVPGAYRTRGGHWRIRSKERAFAALEKRRRAWGIKLRNRAGGRYAKAPVPKKSLSDIAFEFWQVSNGLIPGTLDVFTIADKKRRRIIWGNLAKVNKRRFSKRELPAAANDPDFVTLFIVAKSLAMSGETPTSPRMADALKISLATFYRKFPADKIALVKRFLNETASVPDGAPRDGKIRTSNDD